MLRGYRDKLKVRGLLPSSVLAKFMPLMGVFIYAVDEKLLEISPMVSSGETSIDFKPVLEFLSDLIIIAISGGEQPAARSEHVGPHDIFQVNLNYNKISVGNANDRFPCVAFKVWPLATIQECLICIDVGVSHNGHGFVGIDHFNEEIGCAFSIQFGGHNDRAIAN